MAPRRGHPHRGGDRRAATRPRRRATTITPVDPYRDDADAVAPRPVRRARRRQRSLPTAVTLVGSAPSVRPSSWFGADGWQQTATLQLLDLAVAVHSDDPALLALVDALYAPSTVDRSAEHALFLGRVRVGAAAGWVAAADGGVLVRTPAPGVAFRHLVYEANQMAIDATEAPVRLHAGAVARAGRAVALVGPMGARQVDARRGARGPGLGVPHRRGRRDRRRWPGAPVRQAVLARRAAAGAGGAAVGPPPALVPYLAGADSCPAAGARRGGRCAPPSSARWCCRATAGLRRPRSPSSAGRRARRRRGPRLRALGPGALAALARRDPRGAVLPAGERRSRRRVRRRSSPVFGGRA